MSNKDFTTDFSEGEQHTPNLHDAGIEPSGQGEGDWDEIPVFSLLQCIDMVCEFGNLVRKVGKNMDMPNDSAEFVADKYKLLPVPHQTSLLSRQLLRSEQKNQAKDEEIQRLQEALDKIISMKLKPGETDYRYAFNRTWHIASEALNPSSKTSKEDI